MEKLIHGTWKRVLSLMIVFALIITMLPTAVFAAGESETEYFSLVQRLKDARDAIRLISSEYGEVDFGNGYTVDIKAELENFANNIDRDLGVAEAIVAGNCDDPRLKADDIKLSDTKNYNQTNFNKAFSKDLYNTAVTYFTDGGVAAQEYGGFLGAELKFFIGYRSKLNSNYYAKARAALLGGIDIRGMANIVEFAEKYVDEISKSVLQLSALLDILKDYKAESEGLEAYFLSSPCTDVDCPYYGKTDEEKCQDWTHRILVAEGEDRAAAVIKFENAVNNFRNDINKDIKIAGALATGQINSDTTLWSGNINGSGYYNNTAAKTAVDKMYAAIRFLENGGYTCGNVELWTWKNQLSCKSSFNSEYNIEVEIEGFSFNEKNTNPVLPLVNETLSILRSGTTAGNLKMVYALKVKEIERYIDQVEQLKNTVVPEGGTYSQEEYENAIVSFIANAERDLLIAGFLLSGDIENEGYASKWSEKSGSLKEIYKSKSPSEMEANAIRFFNEGGYYEAGLLGLSYELEYKSSFHKDYSSGLLFGIAANKKDAVVIMRDTAESLKLGNRYMTSKEQAIFKYEKALSQLNAAKDDPNEIVKAVLESDEDLKLLIGDLNIIVGSLDDIIDALDKLNKLGIGKDIIDPILSQMGLSYDMLNSIAELRDLMNDIGIDTSGDIKIEESMDKVVGGLVSIAVDTAVGAANIAALPKTEAAYNTASVILNETYTGLKNNAANALKLTLEPVVNIVEPMRPYLNMLGSSISLVNRMVTIVDQVNELSDDFTMGGLSETTYTLAYILDDTADLMTAFGDARLAELLGKLLESVDLGGSAANATAGLLNQIINQLAGQDAGISGEDLGFIRDLIDTLKTDGLKNTAKLVPLLRTSSSILKRVAELEGGIQDIIDKDYESAWYALTNEFGSMLGYTVTLWNDIIGLFTEPVTGVTAAMSADTGELSLDGLEGDAFLQTFAKGINDEATDTLRVLISPSCSYAEKYSRFNQFKEFTKNVEQFVKALENVNKEIKDACKWAEDNLTKEEAKDFLQKLGRHYVEHMYDIIKAGFNKESVKNIIAQLNTAAEEIKDLICLIKQNGDIEIIATPGSEEVFYNLSTNYDTLREKLDGLFKALGISTEFALNSELFRMDGNAVKASGELEDNEYQIKALYRLKLYLCSREVKITLATKKLDITVDGGGEVPDPVLIGLRIDKEYVQTEYKVNEKLNLDGLKVYAVYNDNSEDELTSEEYAVAPAAGADLAEKGTFTVTVSYEGFTATFEINVNDEGGEVPAPVLTGIRIDKGHIQIEYKVNEKFNLDGLKVYAVYDDNSELELTSEEYTVTPAAGTTLTEKGTLTVTVTYKGFTDTFEINVNDEGGEVPEPIITHIAVRQLPNKTMYTVNEILELEGLRVYAIYDNDFEDELDSDEYTAEPSQGTVLTDEGTITVTVSYGELSDSFDVTVKPAGTEEPEKQNYTVIFNANGGALASGAEAEVTVTSGTAIRLPGVAVRTNYNFNGWYDINEHAGNAGDLYIVLRDAVLVARWTYVVPENPDPGDGGNTGGGSTGGQPPVVEIAEQEVPLAGIYSLLSLDTEFKDGIVYYIDDGGRTIFVPFCFTIGNKVYFLGYAGIDYYVKENIKQFGDVEGHWAYDNILAIAAREVFQGYPDSSFKPDQPMTRAMLATVLARMAIADTSAYSTQIFDDVSMDTWYGPYVAWAFDKGIVLGVGNNRFNPDGYVTREEIAVMLSRFIKYTEVEIKSDDTTAFEDLNMASTWAMDAIDNLQKYGVVTGKSGNKFDPFAETTRGEISTMLYRLIRIAINNSIK